MVRFLLFPKHFSFCFYVQVNRYWQKKLPKKVYFSSFSVRVEGVINVIIIIDDDDDGCFE